MHLWVGHDISNCMHSAQCVYILMSKTHCHICALPLQTIPVLYNGLPLLVDELMRMAEEEVLVSFVRYCAVCNVPCYKPVRGPDVPPYACRRCGGRCHSQKPRNLKVDQVTIDNILRRHIKMPACPVHGLGC